MTEYRFRWIFLLLLMGHATACMTSWEAPSSTASPEGVFVVDNFEESQVVDYIEENQPEFIRGTARVGYEGRGRRQFEMDFPYVEGDKIVSSDGQQSVPIADIVQFEGLPKTDVSVADYIESEQPMEGEPKTDVSYADYIESEQPRQVRITLEDGSQIVLNAPYVQDDKIVSVDGQQSVPTADITEMEGRGLDVANTVQLAGHIVMLPVYALGILLLAYGM